MVSRKARADGLVIRRQIVMPAWAVAVASATVLALCALTLVAGIAIANQNAANLIERYQADQTRTQEANRAVYCTLFRRQADVFAEAETPTGKAAYQAWLELYRSARCVPAR